MSFASPILLWGLLLVPALLLAYLLVQRRRIKYAARFTNLDLLANVVDASPGRRRHVPAVLVLAALAALLVAVARPQAVVAVPREEATVVLTMDGSASMNATDVPPTRLDAAKSAASTFLDELPERFRVGVVSFSDAVKVLEEPTDDRETVRTSTEHVGEDEQAPDRVRFRAIHAGRREQRGREAGEIVGTKERGATGNELRLVIGGVTPPSDPSRG